jgi:hypothetical protein
MIMMSFSPKKCIAYGHTFLQSKSAGRHPVQNENQLTLSKVQRATL